MSTLWAITTLHFLYQLFFWLTFGGSEGFVMLAAFMLAAVAAIDLPRRWKDL